MKVLLLICFACFASNAYSQERPSIVTTPGSGQTWTLTYDQSGTLLKRSSDFEGTLTVEAHFFSDVNAAKFYSILPLPTDGMLYWNPRLRAGEITKFDSYNSLRPIQQSRSFRSKDSATSAEYDWDKDLQRFELKNGFSTYFDTITGLTIGTTRWVKNKPAEITRNRLTLNSRSLVDSNVSEALVDGKWKPTGANIYHYDVEDVLDAVYDYRSANDTLKPLWGYGNFEYRDDLRVGIRKEDQYLAWGRGRTSMDQTYYEFGVAYPFGSRRLEFDSAGQITRMTTANETELLEYLPDGTITSWLRLSHHDGEVDTMVLQKLQFNQIQDQVASTDFEQWGWKVHYDYQYPSASVDAGTTASRIAVFPNPATDILRIIDTRATSYDILNALGQAVDHGEIVDGTISVVSIPKGVYWLRLDTEKSPHAFIKH